MMSAASAVVFLMVLMGGGGPISMTEIGKFQSKAACTTAREAVQNAVGPKTGTEFVCISLESLGDLEKANR